MWETIGQIVQTGGQIYGNVSGATAAQIEAQKQADLRKAENQKKIAMYILAGLVITGIVLIAIFKPNK